MHLNLITIPSNSSYDVAVSEGESNIPYYEETAHRIVHDIVPTFTIGPNVSAPKIQQFIFHPTTLDSYLSNECDIVPRITDHEMIPHTFLLRLFLPIPLCLNCR